MEILYSPGQGNQGAGITADEDRPVGIAREKEGRYTSANMFATGIILAVSVLAAAPVELPERVSNGDIFVVPVTAGAEVPLSLEFLDQEYPSIGPWEDGPPFFLLAVDLETSPGTYPLILNMGKGVRRTLELAVELREYPVEELTLPKAMVTPPQEVLERIAAERKAAAEVYVTSAPGARWTPPFARPAEGEPSGNFGKRRILNGLPRSPHSGEDFSSPRGAEVRAVAGGMVKMARDLYYSGKTLLLDHGAGLVSQYFHLDEMLVGEGEEVKKGSLIGKVGSTGRVTGPHLHFGIRLYGKRVNPSQLWELFPQ
jgi:murein DD-endopeptidase MepM/ murein hydrolase activator NlpD